MKRAHLGSWSGVDLFPLLLLLQSLLQGCAVATQDTAVSPQLDLSLKPKFVVSERLRTSPPRTVAILPLENKTEKEEAFEIVRGALFNHLSSYPFELIKLYRVDRRLQERNLCRPEEIAAQTPQELGRILEADALIYGQITHYDRIYAVFYSQVAVGASLRLVEARTGETLWEISHVSRKHEGGVSTTAWGIALTAVTTAINVRKIELLRAADDLCRDMVGTLPTPSLAQALKPPEITMLASDSGGTVKRAGEVIKVVMAGDPGCLSSFDLGELKHKIPMVEGPAGIYTGTYQVLPGDNIKEAIITARLTDRSGNCREWQDVLGPVTIDTTPPAIPQGLRGKGRAGSALLSWEANPDPDLAGYRLYRSTTPLSGYAPIQETEWQKAEDKGLINGQQYFYRLTTLDRAGNESPPTPAVAVVPVAPGPTRVAGEMRGEVTWYREASPYIISGEVSVPVDSSLIIEPGTQILSQGPPLRVRGKLMARGEEGAEIRITASGSEGWEGLILEGGQVALENCQIRLARVAVSCLSGSPHLVCCDLSQNGLGLYAEGALSSPHLESCTIAFNQEEGVQVRSSARVEMMGCQIDHNGRSGVRIEGGAGVLTGCEIAFNRGEGILVQDSSAEIEGCSFHDNGGYHLYHASPQATPLLARGNYWGTVRLEEILDRIHGAADFLPCLDAPPPAGKPLELPILSSPLPRQIDRTSYLVPSRSPYLVKEVVTVTGGAELRILPGVIIQFAAGETGLLIEDGAVIARGQPSLAVSFRSASLHPLPGDYAYALMFKDPLHTSYLEHCRIEHASTSLLIQAGGPEICRCQIIGSLQNGIECSGQSSPKITACKIAGHRNGAGIVCSGYCKPVLRGNSIVDNAWALVNYSSLLLDARENWWGGAPPPEGLIMGEVDFSGWLQDDPTAPGGG